MAKSKEERRRFSSRKKMKVVLRVLRGEDLDLVSRATGITAAKLSEWRDQLVARMLSVVNDCVTEFRVSSQSTEKWQVA